MLIRLFAFQLWTQYVIFNILGIFTFKFLSQKHGHRFRFYAVCQRETPPKIPAFMDFAKTVRSHWSGIINFVETRITNGVLEGINNNVL